MILEVDTKTMSKALLIMSRDFSEKDPGSCALIAHAAQLIDALAEIATEMAGMLAHDLACPDDCKSCAMQKRLADLGVVV